MARATIHMEIGFTLDLPQSTIDFLDNCDEERGREWGEELLANLPSGVCPLADCSVNDCEVEISNM